MAQRDSSVDRLAEDLREVVSALRRRVKAEASGGPVPYPKLVVLRRLEMDGPATTADLARAELVTPQAMGELIGQIEAAGLVKRRSDPKDGRRRTVAITAAGRRALAAARAARQTWLAGRISERLGEGEQRRLAGAIGLLRRLVDE